MKRGSTMFGRIYIPVALAVLGMFTLALAPSTALAGICTDEIFTQWTPAADPVTFNNDSDDRLIACQFGSELGGSVLSGRTFDNYSIEVDAIDDDTLSFFGRSDDEDFGQIAQFPGFTLLMFDIDWVGMVGVIDDVIDNSDRIDVDSFTDDTITFSMVGFGVPLDERGETAEIDLGTFDIVAHQSVPEPTTILLLGLGLAGLGFARKRLH